MSYSEIARQLSAAQRELLIAHIDKPARPVVAQSSEGASRSALFARKLLVHVRHSGAAGGTFHAGKFTAMTEEGRGVACAILAECADLLVRANLIEPSVVRPFDHPAVNPSLTKTAYRALNDKRTESPPSGA